MEGGAKVIKFLVVFFNFLFFVFGCVLIGYGAYALIEFGDYVTLTDGEYATGSKVMIAAGVLIALISFFGCCGAWKENRCLLVIFFICLLVILCLEIAFAVLGYTHRNKIDDEFNKQVIAALQSKYGEDDNEGTTDAFNLIQKEQKCCGWYNYTDWQKSKFANGSHSVVPDSCCKNAKENCGKSISSDNIYKEGCKEKVEDFIKERLYVIGALGVTIVVIQVLGMIFALVLICRIGKDGTYA